jgi:PEP-CTERM motif-containing protein
MNATEKREKSNMKICLAIGMSLALATAAVRGQDLPTYQGVISGQGAMYYNQLATGLAPSIGSGTFVATAGTGFTNDYFGNANDASYFTTSTSGLSLAGSAGLNVINNSANGNIGSISLLIYAPNTTQTGSRYFFDNGDTSPNEFELKDSGGTLNMQVGNLAIGPGGGTWTLTSGTWYYFAATWNFSGQNSSAYGINYYLGPAGQGPSSLLSGFTQRGGSGNISSGAGLGGGGTVTVSGNLSQANDGFEDANVPGFSEALASFPTELSSSQIASQYAALVIPEPSTLLLCGFGLAGLWAVARRRPASKK